MHAPERTEHPGGTLSEPETARALRLSVREGAAWAFMLGLGETYFVADAVRLGASTLELALVVTLPLAIAGGGPLAALVSLRTHARRTVAVIGALVQASVLAVLALLDGLGHNAPATLIALACLYQMSGQGAGTAWSSWYGDVVPEESRGRYFARRNRVIYASTCLGLVGGGVLLHLLEPRGVVGHAHAGAGFSLIFGLAALCRSLSVALLARSPEPAFAGLASRRHTLDFLRTPGGRRAGKLLFAAAMLYFAAYLASPYFAPYMLETLEFTYVEYMIASIWVVVAKAGSTVLWGRVVERSGPSRVFGLGLVLVAIVPLPWLVARDLTLVLVGQGLSGFAWCAYELGFFTGMLGATTAATRPAMFALQSMVMGWIQLGASVVGAMLVTRGGIDLRVLFAISAVARGVVAVASMAWTRRMLRGVSVRTTQLPMRVFGFRPSGGISRRPVIGSSAAATEEKGRA